MVAGSRRKMRSKMRVVRTFQDLLTEKGDWRLNIGGMTFEGWGNEDDERLEITILKDEVLILFQI